MALESSPFYHIAWNVYSTNLLSVVEEHFNLALNPAPHAAVNQTTFDLIFYNSCELSTLLNLSTFHLFFNTLFFQFRRLHFIEVCHFAFKSAVAR
jgi:hypothetical protein